MTALIVVGCVAAYLVGGGALYVVFSDKYRDDDVAVPAAIIWPVSLLMLLGAWLGRRYLKREPTVPKAKVVQRG